MARCRFSFSLFPYAARTERFSQNPVPVPRRTFAGFSVLAKGNFREKEN